MDENSQQYDTLIAAWSSVYKEKYQGDSIPDALKQLLDEQDVNKRREHIRDVYAFLHAQQLVSITRAVQDIETNISQSSHTSSYRTFWLFTGVVVGAAITFVLRHRVDQVLQQMTQKK